MEVFCTEFVLDYDEVMELERKGPLGAGIPLSENRVVLARECGERDNMTRRVLTSKASVGGRDIGRPQRFISQSGARHEGDRTWGK